MPLHGDPHRLDTVETTLHSLGSQVNTDIHVVIADNGIVPGGIERVTQSAARNGVHKFNPAWNDLPTS